MPREQRAPSVWQVVRAIARREIALAARRRFFRFLFVITVIIPLGFGIAVFLQVLFRNTSGMDLGAELGWDPVLWFLSVQIWPVALLALGLGTPTVARDRAEDVLFLYATRPVTPWSYALGKMLTVAAPVSALLLIPGVLIAILRQGILGAEIGILDSLWLIVKVAIVSLFMGWGFAGVSVGPSAATNRGRWAMLFALGLFFVPDAISGILFGVVLNTDLYALGPGMAIKDLLASFFRDGYFVFGLVGAFVLAVYGFLGLYVIQARVRREMTP